MRERFAERRTSRTTRARSAASAPEVSERAPGLSWRLHPFALPAAVLVLAFATALSGAAAAQQAAQQDPQAAAEEEGAEADAVTWIERMNRALLPSDSLTARVRLVTRDGFGGEETIAFDLLFQRRDGVTHTLIEVRKPEGRAGIVYQVAAPEEGPIRRWSWLPEAGRLRGIAGVQRFESFLGSEFTYEDVGIAAPDERRLGSVERIVEDGRALVVVTSEPYHFYGRVVTVIDPETHLPVRVDYYDRADQLFRRHLYEAKRQVEGRLMATRIAATNYLTAGESVLTLGHIDLDAEIPPGTFDRSAVRQRLRHGGEPVPDTASPPEGQQDRGQAQDQAGEGG